MKNNILVFLFLAGVSVCQGNHQNHCKDLTDYGDLYYSKTNVTVCNTKVERKCHKKPVTMCMEVPEIACQVELFSNCESVGEKEHRVTVSTPVMEMKTLPLCEKTDVLEDHNKTRYTCENVTRQQCTSLWKVVNGEKVWAGNDDCRDVTWEECKPQTVSVQWLVPQMNCTAQVHTFLTFQNQTNILKTEEEKCRVEKRTVCERVNRKACSMINLRNCTESPVTKCTEVAVPVPAKDKIHKRWCLFDRARALRPRKSRSLSFNTYRFLPNRDGEQTVV